MEVDIDTAEVRALGLDMQKASDAAQGEVDKAAERISEAVAATARRKVPRETGAARASLRVIGGALTAGGSKARYYGWLDFGGDTGGAGVRGKRPYRRGGRYIYPALVSEESFITKALEDAAEATLKAGGLDG